MDLSTRYMGLALKNPLVASASPLNTDIGNLRRLEDAGAAAVVLPSLFEEQIEAEAARHDHLTEGVAESFHEALSYFPEHAAYHFGPHQYLDLIARAGEAVDIPVIASLNGTTDEGWISYARSIEEAGAKGLELNIYFIPADISMSGRDVEKRYIDIVKTVRKTVKIPVAVKLSPYFSSIGHMAKAVERGRRRCAGALQPLLPAGPRSRRAQGHSRSEALNARRDQAAAPLARSAAWAREGVACCDDGRRFAPTRWRSICWRAPTS